MPDGVPWWIAYNRSGNRTSKGKAFSLIVVVAVLVTCSIETVSTCTDGLYK